MHDAAAASLVLRFRRVAEAPLRYGAGMLTLVATSQGQLFEDLVDYLWAGGDLKMIPRIPTKVSFWHRSNYETWYTCTR